MLVAELVVALDAVLGDADHHRARRLEVGAPGGEALRLEGAAGGVVLGVEVEHHLAPAQVGEAEGAAAVAGQGDVGGGLTRFDARHGDPPLRDHARRRDMPPRPASRAVVGRGRAPYTAGGMRLTDFDFELPEELIALRPVRPRPAARLLVAQGAAIVDSTVARLGDWLEPGDLLVFNDTKVLPARLEGLRRRTARRRRAHRADAARRRRRRPVAGAGAAGQAAGGRATASTSGRRSRRRCGRATAARCCSPSMPAGRGSRRRWRRSGEMPLPPYIAARRRAGRPRPRRLPDRVRGAARGGGGPDCGAAFRRGPARGAGGAGGRQHPGDAARGRRHLPAGEGGAHRRAPHACRAGRARRRRRRRRCAAAVAGGGRVIPVGHHGAQGARDRRDRAADGGALGRARPTSSSGPGSSSAWRTG